MYTVEWTASDTFDYPIWHVREVVITDPCQQDMYVSGYDDVKLMCDSLNHLKYKTSDFLSLKFKAGFATDHECMLMKIMAMEEMKVSLATLGYQSIDERIQDFLNEGEKNG